MTWSGVPTSGPSANIFTVDSTTSAGSPADV